MPPHAWLQTIVGVFSTVSRQLSPRQAVSPTFVYRYQPPACASIDVGKLGANKGNAADYRQSRRALVYIKRPVSLLGLCRGKSPFSCLTKLLKETAKIPFLYLYLFPINRCYLDGLLVQADRHSWLCHCYATRSFCVAVVPFLLLRASL